MYEIFVEVHCTYLLNFFNIFIFSVNLFVMYGIHFTEKRTIKLGINKGICKKSTFLTLRLCYVLYNLKCYLPALVNTFMLKEFQNSKQKKIILNEKLDWEVFNSLSSVNCDDSCSRRKDDKLQFLFPCFQQKPVETSSWREISILG